jgi:CheY-like chemotaxis protein
MSDHRILLVEDDRDIRDGLREFLEGEGCAVETASNGREALDALRSAGRPCVILLDLFMPVMDGYQFLTQVDVTTAPPVVVISAAPPGSANQPAALPLNRGCLKKPLDLDAVLRVIKKHCCAA